jgi:hypothetical protein
VTLGAMISAANVQMLQFDPVEHNNHDGKFKFTAVDNLLGVADRDATYTVNISMINYKKNPQSINIIAPAVTMNPVSTMLLPLVGSDSDGVVMAYKFTQLPPANQEKYISREFLLFLTN